MIDLITAFALGMFAGGFVAIFVMACMVIGGDE